MPTEVTTGKVSFEITNVGAESHELILSNKGDTFKEIVVAADKKGLATIAPAPGGRLWTKFNLRPGKYTAVCYIPDAETGKPHVRLGMKADFIVK